MNPTFLLLFAMADGIARGFGGVFFVEYVLFGLVAAHGAYFGRKLAGLAEAEWTTTPAT